MNTVIYHSHINFEPRHYHSDLSIWLSVDPMADKYPNLSPYAYCGDNPIKLVDSNGMEITDPPKALREVAQSLKTTLNNLGVKVRGTVGNYEWEGHSDGANRGTITQQDAAVGGAVVTTMVTLGVALEAETIGAGLVSVPSVASSVDDMTTDALGQTAVQRATENNSIAKGFVNFTKAISSFVSAGSSAMTIIDKGVEKTGACVIDVANGAYNGIKSTITAVKDFINGNDVKDKNTKKN